MSDLGIWMVRGENTQDDVFYYATDDTDFYMMVPVPLVLRPSRVWRPEVDREEWISVGHNIHGVTQVIITVETLASHTRRIADALLLEVERAKRSAKTTEDLLRETTKERNTYAESDVAKGNLAIRQAETITRIRELLEEL